MLTLTYLAKLPVSFIKKLSIVFASFIVSFAWSTRDAFPCLFFFWLKYILLNSECKFTLFLFDVDGSMSILNLRQDYWHDSWPLIWPLTFVQLTRQVIPEILTCYQISSTRSVHVEKRIRGRLKASFLASLCLSTERSIAFVSIFEIILLTTCFWIWLPIIESSCFVWLVSDSATSASARASPEPLSFPSLGVCAIEGRFEDELLRRWYCLSL